MERGLEDMSSILKVEDLVKYYGEGENQVRAVDHTSLQIERGKFTAIVGRSGSGKSTLLHLIGGLDRPDSGKVWIDGTDIYSRKDDKLAQFRRKKIGFIFQDFYLMDSLSVEENIMLPMILGKEKVDVMTKAAKKYADQFEITHLLKKNPYELSGGEKQRVAICRALINDPDLVLADEPTGNLDSKSGKIVIDALNRINREFGKTIVMVTHDPQMASNCSRIILLKDGVILDTLNRGDNQDKFYQEIISRMADL